MLSSVVCRPAPQNARRSTAGPSARAGPSISVHACAQQAEQCSNAGASWSRAARCSLASTAACVALLVSPLPSSADLGPLLGAELFKGNCAGCHTGGGNIVEPGQTLKQSGEPRPPRRSLSLLNRQNYGQFLQAGSPLPHHVSVQTSKGTVSRSQPRSVTS
jgi:mono/diheme cytochrome c family protein